MALGEGSASGGIELGPLSIPTVLDLSGFKEQARTKLRAEANRVAREIATEMGNASGPARAAGNRVGAAAAGGVRAGLSSGPDAGAAIPAEIAAQAGPARAAGERVGKAAADGVEEGMRRNMNRDAPGRFVGPGATAAGEKLGDALADGAGERVKRKTKGHIGFMEGMFLRFIAWAASLAIVQYVSNYMREAWAAGDQLDASTRKLGGTARQTGTDLSFLQETAAKTNAGFKLGTIMSNEYTVELSKLASKAGDVKLTGDAIAAALDVGADRGLKAKVTLQAVSQAILGIDEGTDKLFGANPSVIYEEYAEKIGVAASALDDQAKAMAILDRLMTTGEKSRGAYQEYLRSNAGQAEQTAIKNEEMAARVGQSTQYLRQVAGTAITTLNTIVGGFLQTLNALAVFARNPINITVNYFRRVFGDDPPEAYLTEQGTRMRGNMEYGGTGSYNPANDPFWQRTFRENEQRRQQQEQAEAEERNRKERERIEAEERKKEQEREAERARKAAEREARSRAEAAARERAAAQERLREMSTDLATVRQFRGSDGQPFASLEAIPSSALRGAIGAVVQYDNDIRELQKEIATAGAASDEVMARLAALQVERTDALEKAQRLASDPANLVPDDVRAARERIDELTASYRRLGAMGVTGLQEPPQAFVEIAGEVERVEHQVRELERAITAVRVAGGEPNPQAVALLDTYKAQRAELAKQADALVPIAGILRDIEGVSGELFKGLSPDQISAVQRALSEVVTATRAVEEAQRALDVARSHYGAKSREALAAERDLTRVRREAAVQTDGLAAALHAAGIRGTQFDRVMKVLRGELGSVGAEARRAKSSLEQFQGLTADFNRVTDAILGMADALGLTESRGVEALRGLQEATQGAAAAAAAYARGDVVGMISGGIQTITGVVKIGQSLFGPNEAAQQLHREQAERMRALTAAIDALRETYLRTVSSNQARDDLSMIQRAAEVTGSHHYLHEDGNQLRRREVLREVAVQLGLATADTDKNAAISSLAEWAREIDERYGTTLSTFIEASDPEGFLAALQAMPAAMQDAIARMGQVGDDFGAILDDIDLQIELGLLAAGERLTAFVAALQEAGVDMGDLADEIAALADVDLSTAEGRARRDELIASILTQLRQGGTDLGDLTVEQIEALLRVARGTGGDDGTAGDPAAGVADPNQVARANVTGTEVQVQHLIAYMATGVDYLRRIDASTAAMLARAGGSPIPPGAVEAAPTPEMMRVALTGGSPTPLIVTVEGFVVDVHANGLTYEEVVMAMREGGEEVGRGISGQLEELQQRYLAHGLTVPRVLTNHIPS